VNPVVHFELPYQDRARAERFCASVFGWQTQFLGPEMGDYVLRARGRILDLEGELNGRAVQWAKRCPEPMPGEETTLELRPVAEMDDSGDAMTPELRENEERLRAELESKK